MIEIEWSTTPSLTWGRPIIYFFEMVPGTLLAGPPQLAMDDNIIFRLRYDSILDNVENTHTLEKGLLNEG